MITDNKVRYEMGDRYLHRAKRIDNGEWVQGFLFQLYVDGGFDWCIGNNPLLPNSFAELTEEDIDWFRVDESTICPCTGIKDKNDNLIFENDICKYYNPEDKDGIGVIQDGFVWWKGGTISEKETITPLVYLRCGQELEVIGNTFDNEEILEKYR